MSICPADKLTEGSSHAIAFLYQQSKSHNNNFAFCTLHFANAVSRKRSERPEGAAAERYGGIGAFERKRDSTAFRPMQGLTENENQKAVEPLRQFRCEAPKLPPLLSGEARSGAERISRRPFRGDVVPVARQRG